jgi:hypothetical protein
MFQEKVRSGFDPLSAMLRCFRLFQEVPVLCREMSSASSKLTSEQDGFGRLASIHNSDLHAPPKAVDWKGNEK